MHELFSFFFIVSRLIRILFWQIVGQDRTCCANNYYIPSSSISKEKACVPSNIQILFPLKIWPERWQYFQSINFSTAKLRRSKFKTLAVTVVPCVTDDHVSTSKLISEWQESLKVNLDSFVKPKWEGRALTSPLHKFHEHFSRKDDDLKLWILVCYSHWNCGTNWIFQRCTLLSNMMRPDKHKMTVQYFHWRIFMLHV